jgi:Asp-tRNA(Asn)/Glu-tRNA(Gln) amidotransferase C subunit
MDPIDEESIQQVERLAALPLSPERRALLAPQLKALVDAANELSRKMAEPAFSGLSPQVRFGGPGGEETLP